MGTGERSRPTVKETLRIEKEARRAAAERPTSGRAAETIARYVAAFNYAERKLKEQEESETT